MIEESESLDVQAAESAKEWISKKSKNLKVGLVHSKLNKSQKDSVIENFREGKIDVLVCTTVIEVGMDVPNASLMIIENAERLGLSQLHQLRGRVGRGGEQSYCILMTKDKLSDNGKIRIETLCKTTDGFEIANVDMQLRGPGEVMGTRQSGSINYKIANIIEDGKLIEWSRQLAEEIVISDPELKKQENQKLKLKFSKYSRQKIRWGTVA